MIGNSSHTPTFKKELKEKSEMADFDDFELNAGDFDSDAELTEVDEAKLKVIEAIRKYTNLIEENIKFQEKGEYTTNFRVLSRYISAMVDLNSLEDGGIAVPLDEDDPEAAPRQLTDEEILEKIHEIEKSITEISLSDLRQVNIDNEEGTKLTLDDLAPKDEQDGDDGSLDF